MNNNSNQKYMSKKHWGFIALIMVVGLVLAMLLLKPAPSKGAEDGHGNHEAAEATHDDEKPHNEEKNDKHAHDKEKEGEHEHEGEGSEQHEEGKDEHRTPSPKDAVGKINLSDAQVKAAAIGIDTARALGIKSLIQMSGEVRLNEEKTGHVVPRVSGVAETIYVVPGQKVKKGQVLAMLASTVVADQRSDLQAAEKRLTFAKAVFEREKKLYEQKISAAQDYQQAELALREAEITVSAIKQKLSALGFSSTTLVGLNRFELRAPFDGTIIEKHLTLGEMVKDDTAVFTLSDLNQVWIDVNVPAKDLPMVKTGKKVTIRSTAVNERADGVLTFVGALIDAQTRTAKARVVLPNLNGIWRPGLFVDVELIASEVNVPVAVKSEAIQMVDEQAVVFVKVPGGFMAQPVKIGHHDGEYTEVVQGLKFGVVYASAGSFILKSELGKASAEHTH